MKAKPKLIAAALKLEAQHRLLACCSSGQQDLLEF
jgi:hypothetical protein